MNFFHFLFFPKLAQEDAKGFGKGPDLVGRADLDVACIVAFSNSVGHFHEVANGLGEAPGDEMARKDREADAEKARERDASLERSKRRELAVA